MENKNSSYAMANGGLVLGLNQRDNSYVKPPSSLTARSQSGRNKGKGKYTLAPMEHRRAPVHMPPPANMQARGSLPIDPNQMSSPLPVPGILYGDPRSTP